MKLLFITIFSDKFTITVQNKFHYKEELCIHSLYSQITAYLGFLCLLYSYAWHRVYKCLDDESNMQMLS